MLQSTQVGVYMAQLDGRKSRWSEVTMMMKRSHHIPTLIKTDATHIAARFVRTRRDQNSCGTATLQNIMSQKTGAYGPPRRLAKANPSLGLPLYQARKFSIA